VNIQVDKISVNDMHCTTCEGRIARKLGKMDGVIEAKANYAQGFVVVEYDTDRCSLDQLKQAIQDVGYTIGSTPKYEKIVGILIIFVAVFLLGNITDAYDIDSRLKENVSYFMLFVIGLFTSLHCVGMCGGLMLSQSIGKEGDSKLSAILPAVSYNAGRILSYTLLGGIVGAIGSVISFSLSLKAGLTVFAGVFMIAMGLNMAGFSMFRNIQIKLPWSKCTSENKSRAPFSVGFLNGLMPCGPLQTMQLYALGSGSALKGAMAMFIFAVGTAPLMLVFGSVTGFLSKGYTQKILKFSGVLVLALGIIMADRGLAMAGVEIPGMSLLRSNTVQGSAAIKAEIKDGVQIIRISANSKGYVPNVLFVQKGIPVKWIIDGEQINSCNNELIVPTLKIEKPLQSGENVIEFVPTDAKEVGFSCWMGMIRGVIKVVDDLSTVDVSKEKPVPSSSGCGGSCCSKDGKGQGMSPDLSKASTEQLIRKAAINGKSQVVEMNNKGYELLPVLAVINKDVSTKLNIISDSSNSLGQKFDIVDVKTKQIIKSFEINSRVTETEFTIKVVGLYGIIKNGEFIGALEVADDINKVDVEKLREKYF
jgi:sulfite exporter TauE/SafE/plastocyanin domain-containing protein/copper chaperone CopZ